jgi:S-adenosylmethionine/arginine decarboxylase-like enzyme
MNKPPWGHHLILDIAGCNDNICTENGLKNFVKALVKAINMTAYGEPLIEHFAENAPEAKGYSLVQLIETSCITGHFSDKNKDAYLDIFSCKEFDTRKALEVVEEHFDPQSIYMLCLSRDAKSQVKEPFKKRTLLSS